MIDAIQSYVQSIGFLRKHRLTWLLWFPLIITFIVVFAGIELTSMATEATSSFLTSWINDIAWLDGWTDGIGKAVYWLFWFIFRILLYFVMAFVGGSVILLLMAPILTYASELVAEKLGREVPKFSFQRFTQDLSRAALLAIKNGFIQFLLTLACFIIGFVPVIGLASPVFIFLINAYFFGYNFADYSLERNGLSIEESNHFVWRQKFKTVGLGAPYTAWLLIPFIGPMTSGFIALFATVGATIITEKEEVILSKKTDQSIL